MVESGPAPDTAPGVTGQQLLKVAREVTARSEGPIDVRVAQRRPPHAQTRRERVGFRGEQEIKQRRRERARDFEVRQVRRGQVDRLRVGDGAREHVAVPGPRQRDVAVAGDDERRAARCEIAPPCDPCRESRRSSPRSLPGPSPGAFAARARRRGELAASASGEKKRPMTRPATPGMPSRRTVCRRVSMPAASVARRRVGEHQSRQAVRRIDGEPLPDHPAKRQTAERERGDAQRVGERQRILPELCDACSRRRSPTMRRGRARRSAARGSTARDPQPARPTCRDPVRANATASAPGRSSPPSRR